MRDKEYRHGLVNAQIEVDLPLQLRAIRKQQDLKQPQLADRAGMKQSRISKMEKPGGAHFTLETLKRLAKALDVALIVRFAPFSELVRWSEGFDPDSFSVPKFEDDLGFIERKPVSRDNRVLANSEIAGSSRVPIPRPDMTFLNATPPPPSPSDNVIMFSREDTGERSRAETRERAYA